MRKNNDESFYKYVRGFLTVFLPRNRCYSYHTVKSYRDTLNLFRAFLLDKRKVAFTAITFDIINIYTMEWRALHQLGGKDWSEHDFGHPVIPEQICRRAAGLQILYGIIEADGQVSAAAPGSRLQQSFFFHDIPKSQKHTVHTAFRTGQTARVGSGKILHLSIRFHTRSRIL